MTYSLPALVFDLGGVLLDWNPRHLYRQFFAGDLAATERFLTEIGFPAWNARQDRGLSLAQAVAELSLQFPQYANLIRAYDERCEELVAGAIGPVVDILEALQRQSYPLYALSNWPAETFRRVRRGYPFLDWFSDIVVSGEVGIAKPDPGIYLALLERCRRTAGECLFIDDSARNVAAAAQLGFATIRFETPEQLRSELVQRGILRP